MRRNRRNQPSLLRTAARASVISSAMTASSQATSNAMHSRAARSATDPPPIEMVPPPAPGSLSPAAPTDLVAQLAQLAQLKEAGALTDDEFQIAKAKLLGTADAAE
ncbi:MAG TPA: SHOCT domain-containing protein [Nodosilinea sp.]|nr:SHOCT domain-containing protein [Nodosilinea sp.]